MGFKILLNKKEICELYLSNLSLYELVEKYKINRSVIKRILLENNIKLRSKTSKYTFNENYFDIIDNQDKAYWLGFIWCDGYLNKRNRTENNTEYSLKLGLSEKDVGHLKLFQRYIDSNHEIKYYDINSKSFNTNYKESRLLITNKHFCKNLYDMYGLIPHRFDISKLINNIPKELYRDFIRGVFDAEGSITYKTIDFRTSTCEEFSIGISTYEELLKFINKILIEEGLTKTIYKLAQRHEGRDAYCRQLRITGNHIVLNILNWLYKDNEELSLERRYEKYKHIVNYNKIVK